MLFDAQAKQSHRGAVGYSSLANGGSCSVAFGRSSSIVPNVTTTSRYAECLVGWANFYLA